MTSTQARSRFGAFGMGTGVSNKEQPRTSTKPVGAGFGNGGTAWTDGIWANNTIGSGMRNGLQESSRNQNDLHDSSPMTEAVTGSRSLLASSESDSNTARHDPWKSVDNMSPGQSTGHLTHTSTSPILRQKSNQSASHAFADSDVADSPYFSITPASANLSSRSSQKNFLDPTSGSFVSGMYDPRGAVHSSRHNSDESDRYGARRNVFGGKEHGLSIQPGRPSASNNVSGYTSSVASRSGSQPPSRSDIEQSSRLRGDIQNTLYSRYGPSIPQNSSFRSNASAQVAPVPPFMMPNGSGQTHGEQLSPAQLEPLTDRLDQLHMAKADAQPSYLSQRVPTSDNQQHFLNAYAQDFMPRSQDVWVGEDQGYQIHPDQFSPTGSGSSWMRPNPVPYRGPAFVPPYSHSPSNSDARLSQPSPFYSSAGTPPTLQQQAPSRGKYNNLANGQILLERKLRGLQQQQQQQQGFMMPQPNHHFQFRHQPTLPYDVNTQNSLRAHPLNPYYPMAPATHLFNGPHVPRGPARDHDMSQQVRSPLLEEFRNNSKTNKRYELKDIYNHVVEFSGDQHGSRFIQQKLETANSDEKDQVFRELHPNSRQLSTDVFGNYVIQKFFEHGNQAQKKMLANQMKNHVLTLSTQMYGCRVVQKALEHILTDQQAELVKELENDVLKCVKDQNGNHVVQKAIERVPAEHIRFIINAFVGQVQALATHPYGCRVIQRMLEHCEEPTRAAVLLELDACAPSLIVDQYGNYVTQHVIEHGKAEDRGKIVHLVTLHLLNYSKHKFASNVVEKTIQFGSVEEKQKIVTALSVTNEKGESPIQALIRDQYGNYVIQKLITQLRGAGWDEFIELIKAQIAMLKRFSFGNGKQIIAVEKVLYADGFPPQMHLANILPPTIDTSAAPTPPLMAGDGQSPQSSSHPSTKANSIDVATGSRKSSGSNVVDVLTPTST